MENDLSVGHYIGIALLTMIIITIAIFVTFIIIINFGDNIKYTKITKENYSNIYNMVNNSSDISLQEKANFNKNYLIFGKKIIGYKVKDVLKEIE